MSPDRTVLPNVCLADWDGTLRQGYTIQDWLPFLVRRKQVDKCYEEALDDLFSAYSAGELGYEQLIDQAAIVHANALDGLRTSAISDAAAEFVACDRNLFSYTASLIKYLRTRNISIIIVSGAPQEILNAYASSLGLSEIFALQVSVNDDLCYYSHIESNYGKYRDKVAVASQISRTNFVALALGNSLSDAPLFNVAERGFFIVDDVSKINRLRMHPSLNHLDIKYMMPDQISDYKLL